MFRKVVATGFAALVLALLAVPASAGHWVIDHIKIVNEVPSGTNDFYASANADAFLDTSPFKTDYTVSLTAQSNTVMMLGGGIFSTGYNSASMLFTFQVDYYVNWVPDFPGETMPSTANGLGIQHENYDRYAEYWTGAFSGTATSEVLLDYAGGLVGITDTFGVSVSGLDGDTVDYPLDDDNNSLVFAFGLNTSMTESGTHVASQYVTAGGHISAETSGSGSNTGGHAFASIAHSGYIQLQTIQNQAVGTP